MLFNLYLSTGSGTNEYLSALISAHAVKFESHARNHNVVLRKEFNIYHFNTLRQYFFHKSAPEVAEMKIYWNEPV